MLETLLTVLSWGLPAPEILIEEDGDICLDWSEGLSISINKAGGVNWAILDPPAHGGDIEELQKLSAQIDWQRAYRSNT